MQVCRQIRYLHMSRSWWMCFLYLQMLFGFEGVVTFWFITTYNFISLWALCETLWNETWDDAGWHSLTLQPDSDFNSELWLIHRANPQQIAFSIGINFPWIQQNDQLPSLIKKWAVWESLSCDKSMKWPPNCSVKWKMKLLRIVNNG